MTGARPRIRTGRGPGRCPAAARRYGPRAGTGALRAPRFHNASDFTLFQEGAEEATAQGRELRSSHPDSRPKQAPARARSAPSQLGEVSPKPAAMTTPPSEAPSELAMLKADCTLAEPSSGASLPWSRMRAWTLGMAAMPAIPVRNTLTATRTVCCAVTRNMLSESASANSAPHIVRTGRSASRPPSRVPTVIPAPASASSAVAALGV